MIKPLFFFPFYWWWKLGLLPRHNHFPKHVTVNVWLPVSTIVWSQTVKTWIKITWWAKIASCFLSLHEFPVKPCVPSVSWVQPSWVCSERKKRAKFFLKYNSEIPECETHILLHYIIMMSWCWILCFFLIPPGKTPWNDKHFFLFLFYHSTVIF